MFIQFDCFLFDEKTQHIHSKIQIKSILISRIKFKITKLSNFITQLKSESFQYLKRTFKSLMKSQVGKQTSRIRKMKFAAVNTCLGPFKLIFEIKLNFVNKEKNIGEFKVKSHTTK